MKPLFLILPLMFALAVSTCGQPTAAAQTSAEPSPQSSSAPAPTTIGARGDDQENARKARALLDQAIQALGGQAFLTIHDMQTQGRTYTFYHGRPTSNGILFSRFVEYPDKERIELTQQRDVAYVYTVNKGFEITYKGPRALEKKDLDDYLRRRRLSLESVLRTWPNDPAVAFFYDGRALAGNLPAEQITLINAQNEAISLFFDLETHLPIKKTYKWRDPVDKERNIEEELFDNYRLVQGVMTPWGFTRYYNGDMQNQRFVNSVRYNQDLNQDMFDPNSNYNPNKPPGKR